MFVRFFAFFFLLLYIPAVEAVSFPETHFPAVRCKTKNKDCVLEYLCPWTLLFVCQKRKRKNSASSVLDIRSLKRLTECEIIQVLENVLSCNYYNHRLIYWKIA